MDCIRWMPLSFCCSTEAENGLFVGDAALTFAFIIKLSRRRLGRWRLARITRVLICIFPLVRLSDSSIYFLFFSSFFFPDFYGFSDVVTHSRQLGFFFDIFFRWMLWCFILIFLLLLLFFFSYHFLLREFAPNTLISSRFSAHFLFNHSSCCWLDIGFWFFFKSIFFKIAIAFKKIKNAWLINHYLDPRFISYLP